MDAIPFSLFFIYSNEQIVWQLWLCSQGMVIGADYRLPQHMFMKIPVRLPHFSPAQRYIAAFEHVNAVLIACWPIFWKHRLPILIRPLYITNTSFGWILVPPMKPLQKKHFNCDPESNRHIDLLACQAVGGLCKGLEIKTLRITNGRSDLTLLFCFLSCSPFGSFWI